MNKIHERLFQALGPLSAAWLEMQKGMQDDLEEGSETNPELVLEYHCAHRTNHKQGVLLTASGHFGNVN